MQKPNEPNESDIEKRKTEPLHVLKVGVGVKTCPFFTKAGIQNIGDLLQHTSSEDKLKEISTRIEELAVGRSNKYKKWSKIENLKKIKEYAEIYLAKPVSLSSEMSWLYSANAQMAKYIDEGAPKTVILEGPNDDGEIRRLRLVAKERGPLLEVFQVPQKYDERGEQRVDTTVLKEGDHWKNRSRGGLKDETNFQQVASVQGENTVFQKRLNNCPEIKRCIDETLDKMEAAERTSIGRKEVLYTKHFLHEAVSKLCWIGTDSADLDFLAEHPKEAAVSLSDDGEIVVNVTKLFIMSEGDIPHIGLRFVLRYMGDRRLKRGEREIKYARPLIVTDNYRTWENYQTIEDLPDKEMDALTKEMSANEI